MKRTPSNSRSIRRTSHTLHITSKDVSSGEKNRILGKDPNPKDPDPTSKSEAPKGEIRRRSRFRSLQKYNIGSGSGARGSTTRSALP
uniref:Ovule protein n=1 Tax=Panagrellus redivivus TaxID=6233 RepID=A0A7E4WBY4_PANRE